MHTEWQGDHPLVADDVKQEFERALTRVGLDPGEFLVEVRRAPDLPAAKGHDAIRYDIYISDIEHPERETCKLHGGRDKNWIEQFVRFRAR